ncbi:MAG: prolyl oligopeptidase family serine peptidase [Verrucomicrobia bacterium]|nr:prolyl oligopeptidase family serine peptidase [Verrucomicrobiota bacterium]
MKLRAIIFICFIGVILLGAADAAAKKAAARPALPENVEKRDVTIFCDGVRMAGDLYLPKGLKPDEKLPAIVFCNGTGGTKGGTGGRLGPIFATNGYIALAFDYRGWGASDSKLIALDKQPRPDAKGEVNVKTRAVRWQMDFADQAMDIRAVVSFIVGETNVDASRVGIWGSSYGGGLVVWTAANDPRVKCVAAQVPGMGGGRGPAAEKYAYSLATKQARGETESVPFETGKMTGKMATYAQMRVNPAKGIGYSANEASEKIKVPTLIIDAENEELMDRHQNGEKVAEVLKSHGVPVHYHVLKGMTHYSVYAEGFAEATKLELEWFGKYLKTAEALPSK